MDTFDWRTQLSSDSRSKLVNKITETLKKHLPFYGPEATIELHKIATRFEENIFINALSQSDYLLKISTKMVNVETMAQNAAGSSSSILATYNNTPSGKANVVDFMGPDVEHLMDNNNSVPSLPEEKPAIDTNDWRTLLPLHSRQNITNNIFETFKRLLPMSGPEERDELRNIAVAFEAKNFNSAVHQTDYFRKISLKMRTLENRSQNRAGHLMNIDDSRHSLPSEMNIGEWRTQLPAESRKKIVNKIMETLIKRFPNAEQQRINELLGTAAGYEEIVFNTAINQEDYLGRISLQMQGMELRD